MYARFRDGVLGFPRLENQLSLLGNHAKNSVGRGDRLLERLHDINNTEGKIVRLARLAGVTYPATLAGVNFWRVQLKAEDSR